METPSDFRHQSPTGYFYSFEEFKPGTVSIWLNNKRKFDYNMGKPTRTIWGFWKSKTEKYYAPVNSKTIGKQVNFKNTTCYTSMPIKITPLERAFR